MALLKRDLFFQVFQLCFQRILQGLLDFDVGQPTGFICSERIGYDEFCVWKYGCSIRFDRFASVLVTSVSMTVLVV